MLSISSSTHCPITQTLSKQLLIRNICLVAQRHDTLTRQVLVEGKCLINNDSRERIGKEVFESDKNSWEFVMGVCRPVLQILTRFQTKNEIFRTRFQTRPPTFIPVFRPDLQPEIMLSLLRLGRKNKQTQQIHFELAYFSFQTHLELKRYIPPYTPVVSRKPYPIPDQNG